MADASLIETARDRVSRFTESNGFQNFILIVIGANAAVLGLETSKGVMDAYGAWLVALDQIALVIFVAEIGAKLFAQRLRFFLDPWNVFDFIIVSIALLALPLGDSPAEDHTEDASLVVLQAVILITVPIVLRWISISILHCCLSKNETRFWDLTKRKRFLHILANTWVTMPVRSPMLKDQVRKGTEICWSMGLAGINILVIWAMTITLMEHRKPRFLPASNFNSNTEFLLVGVLPSLLCQVIGCVFLLVHYKKTHPWRNVYTRQRAEETKSALKEEVNTFKRLINIAVQVVEESEVDVSRA